MPVQQYSVQQPAVQAVAVQPVAFTAAAPTPAPTPVREKKRETEKVYVDREIEKVIYQDKVVEVPVTQVVERCARIDAGGVVPCRGCLLCEAGRRARLAVTMPTRCRFVEVEKERIVTQDVEVPVEKVCVHSAPRACAL